MTKYIALIAVVAAAVAVIAGFSPAEASFYDWCGWSYKPGCGW